MCTIFTNNIEETQSSIMQKKKKNSYIFQHLFTPKSPTEHD